MSASFPFKHEAMIPEPQGPLEKLKIPKTQCRKMHTYMIIGVYNSGMSALEGKRVVYSVCVSLEEVSTL